MAQISTIEEYRVEIGSQTIKIPKAAFILGAYVDTNGQIRVTALVDYLRPLVDRWITVYSNGVRLKEDHNLANFKATVIVGGWPYHVFVD